MYVVVWGECSIRCVVVRDISGRGNSLTKGIIVENNTFGEIQVTQYYWSLDAKRMR